MNHPRTRARLSEYLDRKLAPEQRLLHVDDEKDVHGGITSVRATVRDSDGYSGLARIRARRIRFCQRAADPA